MGDLKVEGKVSEWCSKCKHCIAYDTIVTNGICKITTYTCEDPYDGLTRELDAEDDICCSMFEIMHDMPYDKMSRLEHELEMDRLRKKIHQLEKEKVAHMKGIERLKGSNNDLKEAYNHLLKTFKRENESGSKIVEENTKLKEEIEALKSKLTKMRFCQMNDDKRWDELNNNFCLPLCDKLYGTTKVNKTYGDILSDISDLKDRADGNYKASIRKDDLIRSLRNENKTRDDEIMRLQWRNDNQSKMIQDLKKERDELEYWKERCHKAETDITILNSKVEVLDKRNTNQSVIIGEKGKEIENLTKKNRELQIRVNDLIFQHQEDVKKIIELKDDKYRILKENEYLRNRYPNYSAMKAEDKIEHIHEQAKKWKRKYKEAYDILQEFFGEHSNIMSISYDLSGDHLTLKLLYNDSAYTKHNRLEKARERMKKLD